MIKNIIFDFDGVLCESVNIKTEAFYEMYLPYGAQIAENVKAYHLKNGGMPRRDKFMYFESILLNKTINNEKLETLSNQFSSLVVEKVINSNFVNGAYEVLRENSSNYFCFIVSATPMDEMKYIAKKKGIAPFFKEVYGSPVNKIEWTKHILSTYNLNSKETLFIGDAESDFIASQKNNTHFLLRATTYNKNTTLNKCMKTTDLLDLELLIIERFNHA